MKIQLIKAIKNDLDHAKKQVEAKEMLQKLYPDAEIWTPDEICKHCTYNAASASPFYDVTYYELLYLYSIKSCLYNIVMKNITHCFDVDKYNGENFESNGKIIECAFCAEIGVKELIIEGNNE